MKLLDPLAVRWLVVHTAAHPGDPDVAEIRRWHVEERGWSDIGYHFVIRKDGSLETGRSLEYQGAHCYGINSQSIGVCCSGDGDTQAFTPEQTDTLLSLAVRLHKNYGVQPDDLIGHREINGLIAKGTVPPKYVTAKSCPGRKVSVNRLRRLFRLLLKPPPTPEIAIPRPPDQLAA